MAKGTSSLRFGQLAGLFLGLLAEVQGLNCDISPFALEYGNTVILNAPDIFSSHRSVQWEVGSQRANLGMSVGTTLNSTFLPDAIVCTTTPDRGCVAWRGGLFNTTSSNSWTRDIGAITFNGSVLNAGWDYLNEAGYLESKEGPLTRFPHGWDTIQFQGHQIIGFPMTVVNDYNFPFGAGMIGLADQSIFLNQTVENDLSPSRSWALDFGPTAEYSPGELVVGGYNPNKATYDTFVNYTVFPDKSKPCPLQVNVKGIKWGSVDLMEGQETFMACVEPAYWTTIMPLAVQQNFNKTMLAANDIEFWQATWEYYMYNSTNGNSTDFQGLPTEDFTIELEGITVTIPREEWIYPAVQINHGSGGWDEIPGSIQTTVGTAGWAEGVEPKLPFLGGPFLSQVYLVVDYETGVFSLAPIQRPAATGRGGLVKLGCDVEAVVATSGANGTSNTSNTSTSESKSNTGAIAGGVVGGVAALVLIAGAFIFFTRRRRNNQIPVEQEIIPGPTKEQNEVHQMGFHQQPYDLPPAFSPSTSPGPYSPSTSPGPYGSMNMAAVPMRRPIPGDQYSYGSSPPGTQQGYYDAHGQGYRVPSQVGSEPAELGATDMVSELSANPVSYSGGYDGSVVSGQGNR